MQSVFDSVPRRDLLLRLETLQPGSVRQWGKMNPAQMLAHVAAALETATGDRPMKQKLLGKIITPFIRSLAFGEKPFSRNSPTDPTFVISDQRDFDAEKKRVLALIERFLERGPVAAGNETHAFFGRMSGDEWGRLIYKHVDHHLRQFGV